MEERQVTIGEHTYPLPDPFLVLATQNPIEHEGTYPLPEAQLDRFLLKLLIRYPSPEEEIRVLEQKFSPGGGNDRRELPPLEPVLSPALQEKLRAAAAEVRIDRRIAEYLVAVVTATRPAGERAPFGALARGDDPRRAEREGLYRYLSFGASPRASIALYRCCRIRALFEGRLFVSPEDVKAAAYPVLRHRIVLSYEAEADGLDTDTVISRILTLVPVP
jgi:MoxR-like ATPase